MSLNIVLNDQPTRTIALDLDTIPALLNQTRVAQPPGSIGEQASAIASQLKRGNPGGIDAVAGIGAAFDAGA